MHVETSPRKLRYVSFIQNQLTFTSFFTTYPEITHNTGPWPEGSRPRQVYFGPQVIPHPVSTTTDNPLPHFWGCRYLAPPWHEEVEEEVLHTNDNKSEPWVGFLRLRSCDKVDSRDGFHPGGCAPGGNYDNPPQRVWGRRTELRRLDQQLQEKAMIHTVVPWWFSSKKLTYYKLSSICLSIVLYLRKASNPGLTMEAFVF